MTAPRPTAVGYVSAPTPDGLYQQSTLLASYAAREGLSLAHTVEDPRDGVTLIELLDLAERHDAVRVLLPAGVAMAARHRSITEILERIDAVCTVVSRSGTAAAGWMICLDIDGTLTREGGRGVPAVTVEAVTDVRAAGHDVVLASGRSLIGVMPIVRVLGMTSGWVVASNGAVTARLIPDAPGYLVEDAHTFDVGPVAKLALDLVPDVRLAAEEIGQGYRVSQQFRDDEVNGAQRVVGIQELWSEPTPRLILSAPGAAASLLEPIRALGLTANTASPDWVDVTPPGLSKATALGAVRRRLGVPPERTVAVGDGGNDLQMFAWAERAVAMGNAPQAVRDAADETTGSVDQHGVVDVLHSLLTNFTDAADNAASSLEAALS
jgi:HAD superfamily hydrolase (TIGR01484 family)